MFRQPTMHLRSTHCLTPGNLGRLVIVSEAHWFLNMARLGMDLRAVVSFHGALDSFHIPAAGEIKSEVLVCHGASDQFISQEAIDQFKSEMDTAEAIFEFISYEGALHGFSNPAADERGKKCNLPLAYNENADRKSWEAMKALFERVL